MDAHETTVPRAPIAPGKSLGARFLAARGEPRRHRVARGLPRQDGGNLLALMRGLYCAFCRRHIAQLGTTYQKLKPLGVDTLAVVAIQPKRARLYYRYRPVSVPLAADPELSTHRAYGVPQPALSAAITAAVAARHGARERPKDLGDRYGGDQKCALQSRRF